MVVVLCASLALAVFRTQSSTCAGIVYLLTRGVFAAAVVGAVSRKGAERVWWVGFVVFGGGYLAVVSWQEHAGHIRLLPTTDAFDFLWKYFGTGILPEPEAGFPGQATLN